MRTAAQPTAHPGIVNRDLIVNGRRNPDAKMQPWMKLRTLWRLCCSCPIQIGETGTPGMGPVASGLAPGSLERMELRASLAHAVVCAHNSASALLLTITVANVFTTYAHAIFARNESQIAIMAIGRGNPVAILVNLEIALALDRTR